MVIDQTNKADNTVLGYYTWIHNFPSLIFKVDFLNLIRNFTLIRPSFKTVNIFPSKH